MPRIKLASWYGDKSPGEEMDVDDAALKALRRDGLVAEVLGGDEDGAPEPDASQAANDSGEPDAAKPAPRSGRSKR
jgi:hypothetical protein